MTASATDRGYGPWTYERLSAATEVDNVQREIIDGWLYVWGQRVDDPYADVVADSARFPHAEAVAELFLALRLHARERDLVALTAPMDVAFGDRVLQPDVLVLPHAPSPSVHPVDVTPVLVAEVSSPSTRAHDLLRKRRIYEEAGVREYWFVDLEGDRVEAYVLGDDGRYGPPTLHPRDATLPSAAIDGFALDVTTVLGPPPV